MDVNDETAAHPPELTLLEYVVGELGPDTSDGVRVHVEGCPECRERIVEAAGLAQEIDPEVADVVVGVGAVILATLARGEEVLPDE